MPRPFQDRARQTHSDEMKKRSFPHLSIVTLCAALTLSTSGFPSYAEIGEMRFQEVAVKAPDSKQPIS